MTVSERVTVKDMSIEAMTDICSARKPSKSVGGTLQFLRTMNWSMVA